jgi:multiple sugar transport system permease protein
VDVAGLFGLPALAWFLLFLVGPLVAVFVYSTTNATSIVGTPQFVGLTNFRRIFTSEAFWASLRNTALEIAIVVPLMVVLGFMLGYYLFTRPPLARLLRVFFFTSALLSAAAKAMVFYAVLAPSGLLNQALGALGLSALQHTWLSDQNTALAVIMAIDLWVGIGFLAILFTAQMTSVSGEVIEAARIDGCGDWRAMWHISWGMLQGFAGVIAMLQFLWTLFGSATNVLLLTRGGPGNASSTLSWLVYTKAFDQYDIGYSQAVGVVLFLTGIVGVVIIRSVLRSRV